MTQARKSAFWIAALFMALFTADVLAGAFFRAAFMSDVAEALVLAISCCFFVVGILSLEGQRSDDESMTIQREEETR
ncbi:MAG: hypothetical protein KI789_02800 [Hoeflea sp.]|jgi:uncharacterized membrane protein YhaH (DUF805 family)|nr:hypothetical protein [Hoeflea sp.]